MAEDDAILRSIVFVVAFSALFSFIFAYTSPMFMASEPPDENSWISANFDPEQIASTTFWTNDGNSSYNITSAFEWNTYLTRSSIFNTESGMTHDGDEIEFSSDRQTVRVYPVHDVAPPPVGENNLAVENSFIVYQQWGWWDREWETITFDAVMMNMESNAKNQQSTVHIDLKSGMDVWFIFPLNSDPMALMTLGYGFTIVVGQSLLDAIEGSQNVWNAISGLLTFSIDTGYSILNYLISLPIYLTIAYITLTVVAKLIPGLG